MLACHVHWTHRELMELDHAERRRWLSAILEIRRNSP
jgi:hypothetical protein